MLAATAMSSATTPTPVLHNPQRLDAANLTPENVDEYKRSDCRFYKQCLSAAARANWAQFHCNDCRAFEPVEANSDEQKVLTQLGRLLAGNSHD
jgi:hypothetical protein